MLALGARVNFFGVEGAEEHAFPMYTLHDAVQLRAHVLERWEAADKDPSLVDDGALNIVIVGGGPTGVESAGAIAELYRNEFDKDYPDVPQDQARIILVEAGPVIFSMFKKNLQTYAKKALEERGVEVMTGESVKSIAPTRVTLGDGTVLNAHTLVWGAGLQGSPLADALGLELERGNRIAVEPDLSISGHPEVFAVGDVAAITDTTTKRVLPQLGSVALQAGEWAGEEHRAPRRGQGDEALRVHGQGHDGDDRPRRGRGAVPSGPDHEGRAGVPRVGSGPPRAAVHRRGPREGGRELDVGGVLPRACRQDHRVGG